MHILSIFYQPGRNGYYGPTSPTRPPYIIGAQMNPQYNLNTQHVGHLGNFGEGLEEVKHSIRQDEAFGGQRHNNGNSRPIRYSESRQYDLQNERKSDKDYVLVSKTAQNGYKPEEIVINQMEVILLQGTFPNVLQYHYLYSLFEKSSFEMLIR